MQSGRSRALTCNNIIHSQGDFQDGYEGMAEEDMERLCNLQDDEFSATNAIADFQAKIFATRCSGCCKEGDSKLDLEMAKRALQETLDGKSTSSVKESLHIDYDAAGDPVEAYVMVTPVGKATTTPKRRITVLRGSEMPYVKLGVKDRPTIRCTAKLHGLSERQTAAFTIIMRTLDSHIAGAAMDEVKQLLMSVIGNAGCGKSRIIAALLWHLFQYDSSELVLLTAFTWKASTLVSTPVNEGCSSSTLFGLNPFTKEPSQPGTSDKSKQKFSSKAVMILNDEVFLNSLSHLYVSGVGRFRLP